MVVLQLYRWKFSHKETLYQTLFDWSWLLFFKNEKIAFWATLWGLKGNVYTRSVAHGWLYICHKLNLFAISYGWDVISGNLFKSAFFEGGWVTLRADLRRKGASPTNHCWCQKTRVIALLCGIKISAVYHLVLSQCTHVTDRQTELQLQDTASIAMLAW